MEIIEKDRQDTSVLGQHDFPTFVPIVIDEDGVYQGVDYSPLILNITTNAQGEKGAANAPKLLKRKIG